MSLTLDSINRVPRKLGFLSLVKGHKERDETTLLRFFL